MMIFFTVLLLTYHLVILAKGKLFRSLQIEIGEEEIQKQKLGTDNYKPSESFVIKMLMLVLFGLSILFTEVIYYCVAFSHDNLKYPTFLAIAYFIIAYVIGVAKNKKKVDLSTANKIVQYRTRLRKTRTFKGTLISFGYSLYFAYMLWILIFN